MKEIVEKLGALEREVASERGDFILFALFLRADASDRWDLVVSAPWTSTDDRPALEFLAAKLKERLTTAELITLSRIVLIAPDDPRLAAILRTLSVNHGVVEVADSSFFGLEIKHAYVITARRADDLSTATH